MNIYTKIVLVILILVAVGAGIFMYMTRPVKAPSQNIEETTKRIESDKNEQESVSFAIVSSESSAEFNIMEVLNGKDNLVVGSTNQVAGEIMLDINEPNKSQVGEIRVNARTFKTDNERRNSAIARFILRSEDDKNEFIVFQPIRIESLPEKIVVDQSFNFNIVGNLTISGVTREIVFNGSAIWKSGQKLQGNAQATIMYKDFGLSVPKVPAVASVEDQVVLKVNISALQK